MLASFSADELVLLSNALNEALNGAAISSEAFSTRLGANREEASALHRRIAALLQALSSTGADDGQSDFLEDFGSSPPTIPEVLALSADAVGRPNRPLRQALNHYGVLRRFGPQWVASIEASPQAWKSIPEAVRADMRLYLGDPRSTGA